MFYRKKGDSFSNFFKRNETSNSNPMSPPLHGVTYRNSLQLATLSGLTLTYRKNEGLLITCYPTHVHREKVFNVFNLYFNNQYNIGKALIIKLDSIDTLRNFKNALLHLNRQFNRDEFHSSLLRDILSIYEFIMFNRPGMHVTEEIEHIGPHTKPSQTFLELLDEKDIPIKKLKRFLIAGENPNQEDGYGTTLIEKSSMNDDLTALELILMYGGNPFIVYDNEISFCKSYFDTFFQYKHVRPKVYHLFVTTFSKPTKPVNLKIDEQPKVRTALVFGTNHLIMSLFIFPKNIFIFSIIKTPDHLTKSEINALYRLHRDFFNPNNQNEKECLDDFYTDLFGTNKLITLIYRNEELIGFHVGKVIHSKKYPDHSVYDGVVTVSKEQYRIPGLMCFFSFRIAFGLSPINDKVAVLHNPMHYLSSRLTSPLKTKFPKYQPPHVTELVKEVMEEEYKDQQLVLEETTCYVNETYSVEIRPKNDNLEEKHFNRHMLGYENLADEKEAKKPFKNYRSCPIAFYVSDESFRWQVETARLFGLDFDEHIQAIRPHTHRLLSPDHSQKEHKNELKLPKSASLFWKNKVEMAKPRKYAAPKESTQLKATL